MPNTASRDPFAVYVDALNHAFLEGAMMAMTAVQQAAAAQARPYEAAEASGAATRQALVAMGLQAPGPRSRRLSAAERRELEAREKAAKLGFVGGRFVGTRRAA